jgi:hypothetical protein
MITKTEAESIILEKINQEFEHKQIVSSSYLSDDKNFWVIRANSEVFIKYGDHRYNYVGVAAYLVDSQTGDVGHVGSAQDEDEVLQDIQDVRIAGDKIYILKSAYTTYDFSTLKHFRTIIPCGMSKAKELLVGKHQNWITGQKSFLNKIKAYLENVGIKCEIQLQEKDKEIALFEEGYKLEDTIHELGQYLSVNGSLILKGLRRFQGVAFNLP